MSNKNDTRVAIQETHSIPGYNVYGGRVPREFTIRAMTTVEEKMRLSSTGFDVIPRLISACTVSPENVDIGDLKLFDVQFLMYKLRTVTYGPDYKITLRCPHCGDIIDTTVNLDNLEVKAVPDDFVEPFEIGPLPMSKDVLECRILSSNDFMNIEREAKRIKNKNPNYVGDPEFILGYQYKIEKINGEELPPFKVQGYIEKMNARDLRYFDSKYNKIAEGYGINNISTQTCPHCGKDFNFVLPINDEFFRPTYDD